MSLLWHGLLRIGISILYKFIILELVIYNFFYKKNLDKLSIKKKEFFEELGDNEKLIFNFFEDNSKRKEK